MTITTTTTHDAAHRPQPGVAEPTLANPTLDGVTRAITRRSFCTLATASPAGRPHAAGVLYAADGTTLYVSTLRSSRKARNIAADPHVFVSVPVRRLPVGPPATVQFAATAELLAVDDPGLLALVEQGKLKAITGHGELDLPDGCVVRITPTRRLHTFGLGLSLLQFIRNPFDAAGHVDLADARV